VSSKELRRLSTVTLVSLDEEEELEVFLFSLVMRRTGAELTVVEAVMMLWRRFSSSLKKKWRLKRCFHVSNSPG